MEGTAGLPERQSKKEDEMKVLRVIFIVVLAATVTLGLSGMAQAFHEGGVAHCDGCHSMHNSADNPVSGATNNTLLKGSDASSTCLNCHDGAGRYHIKSTDGSNVNQGGDFYWMTKDYTAIVRGNPVVFGKDDHGHNVIADDFLMLEDQDPDNATAPGGTYPAVELGCHSCHDPHGKVAGGTAAGGAPISVSGSYGAADPVDGSIHGNFRLLGDSSYVAPGGLGFTADAPIARSANGATSYGETTDYGQGMSEWCANCHTDYINDSHKHPSGNGEHLNGYGTNYNSYVATGDFTGIVGTAFDGLVPFERGVDDGSLLSAAPLVGTDANSNVMCLTCHRAHASANANAGKWDFEVELLAESHALESADVPVGAAVYYKDGAVVDPASDYGPYQRSLCNKCHVQD
jgi:hypothetical protein